MSNEAHVRLVRIQDRIDRYDSSEAKWEGDPGFTIEDIRRILKGEDSDA